MFFIPTIHFKLCIFFQCCFSKHITLSPLVCANECCIAKISHRATVHGGTWQGAFHCGIENIATAIPSLWLLQGGAG